MLCYVMLCYVMLCYVMLCYVMLCYVMSCFALGALRNRNASFKTVRVIIVVLLLITVSPVGGMAGPMKMRLSIHLIGIKLVQCRT